MSNQTAATHDRAHTRPDTPRRRVRGRIYTLRFDLVWAASLRVAQSLPRWTVTAVDPRHGTIRAETRTRLWKAVIDLEIHVSLDAQGLTRVDAASAPRARLAGVLDGGARQIGRFLRRLDDALTRP